MSWESPEKPKTDNVPTETAKRRARSKPQRDVGSNRQDIVQAAKRQIGQVSTPITRGPVGCYWFFFGLMALITLGVFSSLLTSRYSIGGLVQIIFILFFLLLLTGVAGRALKNRLSPTQPALVKTNKPQRNVPALSYDTLSRL